MHFLRKESLSAFLFFFICLSKSYEFDKFQLLGPVGQRVGNTIQWLSVNKMHCAKASSVIHYSPSTTWIDLLQDKPILMTPLLLEFVSLFNFYT